MVEIYHSDFLFSAASAWDRVRVQLRDPQDRNLVLPALTICASPTRADKKEVARYNFVLLHANHNVSSDDAAKGSEGK